MKAVSRQHKLPFLRVTLACQVESVEEINGRREGFPLESYGGIIPWHDLKVWGDWRAAGKPKGGFEYISY